MNDVFDDYCVYNRWWLSSTIIWKLHLRVGLRYLLSFSITWYVLVSTRWRRWRHDMYLSPRADGDDGRICTYLHALTSMTSRYVPISTLWWWWPRYEPISTRWRRCRQDMRWLTVWHERLLFQKPIEAFSQMLSKKSTCIVIAQPLSRLCNEHAL